MHRDERSLLWLDQLLRTLKVSIRVLLKSPGLTVTVLLTLALGIGANTAMFTIIYAVFLAPLPYPHPQQLVVVQSTVQGHRDWVSAGDFLDWKRQNVVFQDLNAWSGGGFNLSTREVPENIEAAHVTVGYFQMLGDRFFLGRPFLSQEGQAGDDRVVIITHKLWERLGAQKNIIGATLRLDGDPYTVVGVLSSGSRDWGPQVIVPLVFTPAQINYSYHWLNVVGRLKSGVTYQQAQANMEAIVERIKQTEPKADQGWSVSVTPLRNASYSDQGKLTLWLLMGAVGFILLIASVNVANLLLVKGMTRYREFAIRSALGASKRSIVHQSLTESLLLALTGGLLGVGVGYAILQAFTTIMARQMLPAGVQVHLNISILAFTFGISALAGVLLGSAPAWYASRVDPVEILKEGGRTGTSRGHKRLRKILIVGEFALTLSLLTGAGLAVHSFWNLLKVDLGVRTDHILTFVLGAPESRSKDPQRIIAYYHQILESIKSVPGVVNAAVMSGMPLRNSGFSMPFTIAGHPTDATVQLDASVQQVTPEYYPTFGIQILRGRSFTEDDNASSMKVAMVNEDFVRHFLKGMDPLRQRLVIQQFIPGEAALGPPTEWQIIGVFRTVRSFGLRKDDTEIDIPFWQTPWPSASVGVRTSLAPATMLNSVASAVHSVDPEIALSAPRTMSEIRNQLFASDRFTALLLASFAVLALLLATIGIYGVMAFSVNQRTHEIALRMALGANRSRIIGMIVGEALWLAGTGLLLGTVGAYFVGRGMRSLAFGVEGPDIRAFALVFVVLMGAALVASFIPARRAASIDPMKLLRTE
ncbi:MAG: ABC transporter permease [Acidobacteria bacterium]|nr:ABC transporter permease [Acidobacteriota bacterium]